jgi:dienelactone hydrolase
MPPAVSRETRSDAAAPVAIRLSDVCLQGELTLPRGARGLVLFAHGSGSSRHSPRNLEVARYLQRTPLATLLVDLLTEEEERADARDRALRFDISLLAKRVGMITDWVAARPETTSLPLGYFGASTGAAAALVAAATRKDAVRAIVSRGGRPDLAGDALGLVVAPTLLVVGGADDVVLDLNREARSMMRATCRLDVVPGATHLFSEPGALEQVEALAGAWFERWLPEPPQRG